MSYEGPPWAGPPSSEESATPWVLVEIKGGVELARHSLVGRPFTLLGRDADQCHIGLPHESCSRLHARIAFDRATGTPWLRDLQSTHGTQVNKKGLPAASIGRTESDSTKPGSRGVIIYPGDILQFGASTRMYALEGPEEYTRHATKARLAHDKAVKKTPVATVTASALPRAPIQPEDAMEDDLAMKLPANLSEEHVPESCRKAFQALRALRYKLAQTEDECRRIKRKGILTDGQERQLEVNEGRVDSLRQEIESKEASLFRKIYPEKVQRARQRQQEKSAFFDDGEVEDRTQDRKRSIVATDQAETEESLMRKRTALLDEQNKVKEVVLSHSIRCDELKDRVRLMKARNEEDVFFAENDLQIALDALAREKGHLSEIESQLSEVEELLKIINPHLSLRRPIEEERTNDDFVVPLPVSRPSQLMPPPPPSGGIAIATTAIEATDSTTSNIAMLPPPPPQTGNSMTTAGASNMAMLPPPPPKRDDPMSSATSSFTAMPPPLPTPINDSPKTMTSGHHDATEQRTLPQAMELSSSSSDRNDNDKANPQSQKPQPEFIPQNDWQLISQGAEARLWKIPAGTSEYNAAPHIAKERFRKRYRHPVLDERLTKQRCRTEARVLEKCHKAGIAVPRVLRVQSPVLFIEFIDGRTVHSLLQSWLEASSKEKNIENEVNDKMHMDTILMGKLQRVGRIMGDLIGKLHKLDVIHGDLTTSNMMVPHHNDNDNHGSGKQKEHDFSLYMIDFGLAKISKSEEDRAVDLYVLERALASSHPGLPESFMDEIVLAAYAQTTAPADKTLQRLEQVRLRGRKRECFG